MNWLKNLLGDASHRTPAPRICRLTLEQLEDRVTPSFAVLQYSLNNFGPTSDPVAGLYRYNHASGFQSLLPSDIIADQTAINASGDVVGEFLSKGVWRYTDATNWQQLTPTDADQLAIGPGGSVVGSFHGQGVWRFEDATGWQQLTPTDAARIAIGSNGIVAGEFQGQGVWRFEDATGWQQLTPVDATQFSMSGNGIVTGEFSGMGVWRFEDATGWQQLTPADASSVRVNAVGSVVAAFPSRGTWRFEDATGWQQLTNVDARQLGIGDDNEVFLLYGGTWRYSDATGWEQLQTKDPILLGGEGSGSYTPVFMQHQVFHGTFSGSWTHNEYDPGTGHWIDRVYVLSGSVTVTVDRNNDDPLASWGNIYVTMNYDTIQRTPSGSHTWSGRPTNILFDLHDNRYNGWIIHVDITLNTNDGGGAWNDGQFFGGMSFS